MNSWVSGQCLYTIYAFVSLIVPWYIHTYRYAESIEPWHLAYSNNRDSYSVLLCVVAREYSVLSIRFNTCPPFFTVESKITREFEAQCLLFTYTTYNNNISTFLVGDVYYKLPNSSLRLEWKVIHKHCLVLVCLLIQEQGLG